MLNLYIHIYIFHTIYSTFRDISSSNKRWLFRKNFQSSFRSTFFPLQNNPPNLLSLRQQRPVYLLRAKFLPRNISPHSTPLHSPLHSTPHSTPLPTPLHSPLHSTFSSVFAATRPLSRGEGRGGINENASYNDSVIRAEIRSRRGEGKRKGGGGGPIYRGSEQGRGGVKASE